MRSALVVRKQRKRYLFTSCLDEAFLSLCCFPESVVFFWTSGTTQKRPLSPGLSRRGYVSINCFACLFIYASLLAFLLSLTDSRFLVGSLFYYFFHSVSQVFPTIFSFFLPSPHSLLLIKWAADFIVGVTFINIPLLGLFLWLLLPTCSHCVERPDCEMGLALEIPEIVLTRGAVRTWQNEAVRLSSWDSLQCYFLIVFGSFNNF